MKSTINIFRHTILSFFLLFALIMTSQGGSCMKRQNIMINSYNLSGLVTNSASLLNHINDAPQQHPKMIKKVIIEVKLIQLCEYIY